MMSNNKIISDALAELVDEARTGGKKVRVGLMAAGSELGSKELLSGAVLAMAKDVGLQVVAIGPKVDEYENLEWIETANCESDIILAMELAMTEGLIGGAVALHYPFPMGVATVGRVVTPGRGKPLLIASSTGISAPSRTGAMLRNTIYGIAVAKALNIKEPTVGILNVDGAVLVERALVRLSECGYITHFGSSIRADGGSLLRGNDLLAGSVDVCVCDTLTGNVLVKLFSAFNTGGSFEALGWGYGPSVGEKWSKIINIVSRVSGTPVIANALCYTASLIRGNLIRCVQNELSAAKAAGLDKAFAPIASTLTHAEETSAPPKQPTNSEIHGIDVLSIEAAVKELWKAGIYAESSMGCTGPVVKVPSNFLEQSREILNKSGYL